MNMKVMEGSTTDRFQAGISSRDGLSDHVIPSVKGEFYAYNTKFTEERPLGVLMKCKANKNRPIESASCLGKEANLLFVFDGEGGVVVYSTRIAASIGLLGDSTNEQSFDETLIIDSDLTTDEFYGILSRRDINALDSVCQALLYKRPGNLTDLTVGKIVAIKTSGRKIGLFFVREITKTSIEIDACHVLL